VIKPYQTCLILFRFQWVACQLIELQKCTTPRAVRDVVASMPRSLDDTYERMLLNIPDIYVRDAFRVFQWMVYSARPLMVEEVSETLAFDPDRNPPLDAQRRLFDPKQLLSILSNLATLSTISGWRVPWSRSKTIEVVTFSHYSVQEYLCSERILTSRVCQFSITREPAAYSIAKSCLTYILQFDQTDSLTPETYEVYPLARYAAQYWAEHARQYEREEQTQGNIQPLIEQVFDDSKHAFVNWQRIYDFLHDDLRDCTELLPHQYTPLLCASVLGLVDTVVSLLSDEEKINSLSPDKYSPLVTAAARGHSEIVQHLIRSGANVELQASAGIGLVMTPLGASAIFGHEGVLSILLENGADVNTVMRGSDFGWGDNAPLFSACERGHVKIARTLIERGALLDCQNRTGTTALMNSSGPYPKIAIFELLLQAGANVNISRRDGITALSTAVIGLCSGVFDTEKTEFMQIIQALLEKKANPNVVVKSSRDRRYGEVDRSVLHEVVNVGNLAVTRLLLANGADVNGTDKIGETPLMIAANNNHQSILQLLLDNGADVKATFSAKGTAISLAAAAGHESIVQLLIDHMHLTGLVAERWTTSARLIHAIQDNKDLEVTKLLSEGADPTLTDLKMRNSLHVAAYCGHESIMLHLLEHNLDIEAKEMSGVSEMTALDIAISQGHENIVQCLLDRGARTESRLQPAGYQPFSFPLEAACEAGNENIVRMLLDHGADISDNSNNGLHWAAVNGHHSVVKLLLENLLRPAAPLGQFHLPPRLETPLELAAAGGHEETVRFLLDNGAEVDYSSKDGGTALFAAVENSHEGTVRLLLEAGANPSTKLERGATPLSIAISSGHTGVARALREYLRRQC
jgi:ankyrin repeat protein